MQEARNELPQNLRITARHLNVLHTDGAVLVENFFTLDEIASCITSIRKIFEQVTPEPSERIPPEADEPREFLTGDWFDSISFPYSDPELNLIGCHPALLEAVRAALMSSDVYMHYNYATAKFTGRYNYSQPLHLDAPMHSFFLPSQEPKFSAVNCVVYLSDVGSNEGALSYLPRSVGMNIKRGLSTLDAADNQAYSANEVLAVGTAGSLLLYFHDVYHRGTSLLEPGGSRYQLVTSYHAVEATTFIGGAPWTRQAMTAEWKNFLPYASVEQLTAIGFPPPGHSFWRTETIEALESRFDGLNLRPYRLKMLE